MTESPEQMTRRILAERYPRPKLPALTRALMVASLTASFPPPCRLCGGWGGHHDGCALGERAHG